MTSLEKDNAQDMAPSSRMILGISVPFQGAINSERAAVLLKVFSQKIVLSILLLDALAIRLAIEIFFTKPDAELPRRPSARQSVPKKVAIEGLVWDRVQNMSVLDDGRRQPAFQNVDKMPTIAEEC